MDEYNPDTEVIWRWRYLEFYRATFSEPHWSEEQLIRRGKNVRNVNKLLGNDFRRGIFLHQKNDRRLGRILYERHQF